MRTPSGVLAPLSKQCEVAGAYCRSAAFTEGGLRCEFPKPYSRALGRDAGDPDRLLYERDISRQVRGYRCNIGRPLRQPSGAELAMPRPRRATAARS